MSDVSDKDIKRMAICDELRRAIKTVHTMYYDGTFLQNPVKAVRWHRALEVLFNHALLEQTLVDNNPNEVSPDEFIAITNAKTVRSD